MSNVTSYYCYYILSDEMDRIKSDIAYPEINVTNPNQNTYLYAVTPSERYAKHFEICRNMKMFQKRIINIDEKDHDVFEHDISNYRIGKYPFRTTLTIDGVGKRGDMVIEVPSFEYDTIVDSGDIMFEDMLIDVDFLKMNNSNQVVSDLMSPVFFAMLTDEYHKLFNRLYITDVMSIPAPAELPWDVLTALNQLMMYMKIYGDLYRKEGVIKICEYGDFILTPPNLKMNQNGSDGD